MNNTNLFSLLKNKEIIAILNGDKKYDEYVFEDGSSLKISMPYLSGPDLCNLSTLFGLPTTYSWEGALSRWQYLDNLIEYCIKNDKCSDLLVYMFSKKQFSNMLSGHSPKDVDKAYQTFISTIIDKINGILYFGENELVDLGGTYVIRKIGSKVDVVTPNIKIIDREYIKGISSRAMRDIEQDEFDSAITKARTLLEEVFCYVIEKKGEVPSDDGDINKLFKQVRNLYSLHTDGNVDRMTKTLISGLNSIVAAIAEMRNKTSDAHGVGVSRVDIEKHHALLFVNAAISMSEFILTIAQKEHI